jgi:hypothetical protein
LNHDRNSLAVNAGSSQNKIFMKATNPKLAAQPQIPVFQQTIGRLQPTPGKSDNIFSKSRNKIEDRGIQQKKTSYHAHAFFRPRGNF